MTRTRRFSTCAGPTRTRGNPAIPATRRRAHGARDPRRLHPPVRVPRAPAVEREELLPLERVLVDHGPDVAHANVNAVEDVVALEAADAVLLEAAEDRLVEEAGTDRGR